MSCCCWNCSCWIAAGFGALRPVFGVDLSCGVELLEPFFSFRLFPISPLEFLLPITLSISVLDAYNNNSNGRTFIQHIKKTQPVISNQFYLKDIIPEFSLEALWCCWNMCVCCNRFIWSCSCSWCNNCSSCFLPTSASCYNLNQSSMWNLHSINQESLFAHYL